MARFRVFKYTRPMNKTQQKAKLKADYEYLCGLATDIQNHLPRMYDLVTSLGAKHVIELGTRTGVSTVAWLHALAKTGGTLTSVDLLPRPDMPEYYHWTYIQGDDTDPSVTSKLEVADIVFIDTSHYYDHTKRELETYKNLVKPGGVICLHDTLLETPEGNPDHIKFPVRVALDEFCANTGWSYTHYDDSWGFAVVQVPVE